jgi:Tol biopolymer transport system component
MLIFNSWYTGGRSNIYAAEDNGSDLRCLTADYNLQRYQRLRLSPDHTRLLFLAQPPREETGRFFFWEFDRQRLTGYEQEPRPYDMRWLTDERLLCIKKERRWIVNLETAASEEIDFGEELLVIDVAPGGDRLLMKEARGIGGSIFVGYIDRRELREIVRAEEYEKSHAIVFPAAWSPKGDRIACVGGYEDEVWVVNADGSDPRSVATTDYFWRTIQWSPDGRAIAFTRSLDASGPSAEIGGVFVVDLLSSEEDQVLTLRRGETWRWGADGKSLVYARGEEGTFSLHRVDIRTQRSFELIGASAELKDIAELVVV